MPWIVHLFQMDGKAFGELPGIRLVISRDADHPLPVRLFEVLYVQ